MMPDFSSGTVVGRIATGAGQLFIWKIVDQDQVAYGACGSRTDPANIVGYLGGLMMGGEIVMAKNALSNIQRKGVLSEMFRFVNSTEELSILSDTAMTQAGVSLWKSIISSGKFSAKIFYYPTKELFDVSDVGKMTADGVALILPENDNQSNDAAWDDPHGQRFFYFLESQAAAKNTPTGGTLSENAVRYLGIVQPYRWFDDGEY